MLQLSFPASTTGATPGEDSQSSKPDGAVPLPLLLVYFIKVNKVLFYHLQEV